MVDGIYPAIGVFSAYSISITHQTRKIFAKAQEFFRRAINFVYGAIFSLWQILLVSSCVRHSESMNDAIRPFAILHNAVTKFWDTAGHMDTQNIVNIDMDAQAVPIRILYVPNDLYDSLKCYEERKDFINDIRDHGRLTIALVDDIWERCRWCEL